MVLQLFLIWTIVIATFVWFFRDERRLRADADLAQAARYYAHAHSYRFVPSTPVNDEPVIAPARSTGGLTQAQRVFFAALKQHDQVAQA